MKLFGALKIRNCRKRSEREQNTVRYPPNILNRQKTFHLAHFLRKSPSLSSTVGWRIHWQHLCRGVKLLHRKQYPGYESKQSDGEAREIQELWGVGSTSSLPSLPGQLWPGVVAPERILSMDQIETVDK